MTLAGTGPWVGRRLHQGGIDQDRADREAQKQAEDEAAPTVLAKD